MYVGKEKLHAQFHCFFWVAVNRLDHCESVCVRVCFTDIDECADHELNICGANCNCTNSIGSYNCTCLPGYRVDNPHVIASIANPCNGMCYSYALFFPKANKYIISKKQTSKTNSPLCFSHRFRYR